MNFIEELKWRGLVKDVTDYDGLVNALNDHMTVYCGFDPTADSLVIHQLLYVVVLQA